MKKILSLILSVLLILSSSIALASNAIRMYAPDGRTEIVPISDVEAWKKVGWFETKPSITMYAPDGRTAAVFTTDVENWKNVGWYDHPVTIMYAPDGRTAVIDKADAEAWKKVGWFENVPVTMYAPDGRTERVLTTDVEAWKKVGWYDYPVTIMYAPDGRTAVVSDTEIENWKNVGWYLNPVFTVYRALGEPRIVELVWPKSFTLNNGSYVVRIDSFDITYLEQFGTSLRAYYDISGDILYGSDYCDIDVDCYDSDGFLIDSTSVHHKASLYSNFKFSDYIYIPRNTAEIRFSL